VNFLNRSIGQRKSLCTVPMKVAGTPLQSGSCIFERPQGRAHLRVRFNSSLPNLHNASADNFLRSARLGGYRPAQSHRGQNYHQGLHRDPSFIHHSFSL
jgi:hypothetical protein